MEAGQYVYIHIYIGRWVKLLHVTTQMLGKATNNLMLVRISGGKRVHFKFKSTLIGFWYRFLGWFFFAQNLQRP